MPWAGGLPLGLLRVNRTFTLNDYTGITHFTVRDTASGPLQRLVHNAPAATRPYPDSSKR